MERYRVELRLGRRHTVHPDIRCRTGGDDVRAVAPSALRHRVILNFEGEAEGVDVDRCLEQVLSSVPSD